MSKDLIQKAAGQVIQKKAPTTIKEYIKSMEGEIAKALPKVMTPERFTRIALSAVSNNPQLQECTPQSFLAAMMNAAQLGLEPNTPLGQAYLIPFKNNKKGIIECQFQIGFKGLLDIAYRSGDIQSIQSHMVYENDTFEYELGLNAKLVHKPAMIDRGAMKAVYAVFKLVNGGYGFEVMSIEDVRNHAKKYSQGYSSGYSPWTTNFEEMAKKTAIKKVLKYAPLKTEFVKALAEDETVKTEIDEDMSFIHADYSIDESQEQPVQEEAAN